MANPEHVAILKQGVAVWNAWRGENPGVVPNLADTDMRGTNLEGANLQNANFQGANLFAADLMGANLYGSDLKRASFVAAKLQGANLQRTNLYGAYLEETNLEYADLTGADLQHADLQEAHLEGANLQRAYFASADLRHADLQIAYLREANFQYADLRKANFQHANLQEANFQHADLAEAMFYGAVVTSTIFADVDLRGVQDLDTVRHTGPSHISIDTLYRSGGDIPETFLRGCGVPDSMIEYARSLVAAERPIDYYSVFTSYSSKDEALAKRLHADLQAAGVRCWFAPHDLPIGARIRVGIDEAIRLHDKLLLLLSKHSVASDWVEKEVETAMEQERRQKRTVLFPIRLDTAVMNIESGWPADVRRGRNIGDFSKWKQHDAYQQAFARLLRDLKAEQR